MADYDGGEVVVTDKTGTFRYRYQSGCRPTGIATDTQAQLIVSYKYTYMRDVKIHIIDKNGLFLHFLNTFQPLNVEVGLDVDSEDNLYLAEYSGTVKKIRYMKQQNE